MPTALRSITTWIVATLVAVALAWFGLRPAIQGPPTAAQGRPSFDDSIMVRTLSSPVPDPSPSLSPSPSPSPSPKPSPSASPSPSPTPSPSPAKKGTPAPKPPAVSVRTVQTAGGAVKLENRNGRVEVLDVQVSQGFTGRGWRKPDGTVVIEFRSDTEVVTMHGFLRTDCGVCATVDSQAP